MQIVKASSTFGNSKWSGHADLTDEQYAIAANLGFLWIMQRSPSSNAEKALANDGKGYEKRPDGFKRNSIEYSDEMASRLKELLSLPVEIEDGVSITPVIDSVVFHEIGKSTEPVYKEEKQIIARHVADGDFAQWMSDKVGFAATAADKDSVEVLKAVKAYKQRLLAKS